MTGVEQTLPGLVAPGHFTSIGSRMPPSYSQPLPARNGTFQVGIPSAVDKPPLSERKMRLVCFALRPVGQFRIIVWAEITCGRAGAGAANVYIESLSLGQILSGAEVPLAEKARGVTGLFQRLSKCHLFQRQMIEIFGRQHLASS